MVDAANSAPAANAAQAQAAVPPAPDAAAFSNAAQTQQVDQQTVQANDAANDQFAAQNGLIDLNKDINGNGTMDYLNPYSGLVVDPGADGKLDTADNNLASDVAQLNSQELDKFKSAMNDLDAATKAALANSNLDPFRDDIEDYIRQMLGLPPRNQAGGGQQTQPPAGGQQAQPQQQSQQPQQQQSPQSGQQSPQGGEKGGGGGGCNKGGGSPQANQNQGAGQNQDKGVVAVDVNKDNKADLFVDQKDGKVYADANGNGKFDGADQQNGQVGQAKMLENGQMELDMTGDGKAEYGITAPTTDANGNQTANVIADYAQNGLDSNDPIVGTAWNDNAFPPLFGPQGASSFDLYANNLFGQLPAFG